MNLNNIFDEVKKNVNKKQSKFSQRNFKLNYKQKHLRIGVFCELIECFQRY